MVVCNGSSATVCNQTSPPTVRANNAGEFIRRYSPVVVCNGSPPTVWDQTSPPTV